MAQLPAPSRLAHRLLLFFPSDVPEGSEITEDEDFQGNRRIFAEFGDGDGFPMRRLVAIDYDAAKLSPRAIFERVSSFGMEPVSFLPAKAVASADHLIVKGRRDKRPR